MDKFDVHDQFPVEDLDVNFFDPCGGSVFDGTQGIQEEKLDSGSAEGAGVAVEKKKGEVVSSSSGGGVFSFGGGSLDEVHSMRSAPARKPVSVRNAVKVPAARKESKRERKDVTLGDGVRLTLCLDPELADGLRLLSQVKGKTMSSLVVSALVSGLGDDSRVDGEKDNFKKVVNRFLARYGK